MEYTNQVLGEIQKIASFILQYAIVLAASGALAMALIEAWKKLNNSLAKFHRKSILEWLTNNPERSKQYFIRAGKQDSYDDAKAYEQLLFLTTGVGNPEGEPDRFAYSVDRQRRWGGKGSYERSIEYALFELEIERLMGQVQDAADIALNNPDLYPDLFTFLTRSVSRRDIEKWRTAVRKSADDMARIDDNERKEMADRYTRLKQAVRKHLDSFQIVTAHRWANWNQFAGVVLGAVLLFTAQVLVLYNSPSHKDVDELQSWIKLIGVSIFGGILSPFAKDLVSALQKVKNG